MFAKLSRKLFAYKIQFCGFDEGNPLRMAELPQSKPNGFASSLWEGAFGIAGKFPAEA